MHPVNEISVIIDFCVKLRTPSGLCVDARMLQFCFPLNYEIFATHPSRRPFDALSTV